MIKHLLRKFIWISKGGYQPKEFWDRWSVTFDQDPWQTAIHPQHLWLLAKIKELDLQEILEVGCGFGRNISFLISKGLDAKRLTGVDISPNMIHKARKFIGNNKVKLYIGESQNLPFADRKFDLVFTHGVLMHVKPDEVEKAVMELVRVCRKNVIAIEQNYNGNEYTFVHPYDIIFKKSGVRINEKIVNTKLGLDYFVLSVN